MIDRIGQLLRNNGRFVEEQLRIDPAYFDKLAEGQHPGFLWIGCSDSRVPPDRITGTQPGDMFVHRNIANLVVQTDMNLLSVLQYAVDVLQIGHIIVCGHYGCGGVKAAMGHASHGLIDNWLRTLKDTQQYFARQLAPLDEEARFRRLVELNVIEQVYNLGKTSIVQQAWENTRRPSIHGWVFDLNSGHILPQTGAIDNDEAMHEVCKFHNAVGVR
ncbi:carbonic anhydrase [Variovorax sp. LjRoot290]|uniref:carbonic anhydrase n=1 Tax=unclassified Variovorax TaxID=663243 RepID=UPI003ECD47F5